MTRATVAVKLRVQGPVLTKSAAFGDPGVDAVMAKRDFGGTERFYLPGRLVKGLLLEAWQELRLDGIGHWLGEESRSTEQGGGSDDPLRGRFTFSDFADLDTDAKKQLLRYRIAIEEERGAAAGAMMQVIDSPYAPFQEIQFQGEVRFLVKPGEDVNAVVTRLHQGLCWVRAVGSSRTSGFGEVLGVELSTKVIDSRAGEATAGERWELRLTFSEPVILSKRRIADNLFESGEIVPGAAIKGAIAEMIKADSGRFRELTEELDRVRFTHGFPAKADKPRPTQWPLSLVAFGDGKNSSDFDDALLRPAGPEVLLRKVGAEGPRVLGAFDIDWKDKTGPIVAEGYGWPDIRRQLRVRTAIEGADRKARESALFAWQMLEPDGLEWVAEADTSGISAAARAQLEELLRFGVEPLGKTRALATVKTRPAAARKSGPAEGPEPGWRVTLQTPALLINPEGLAPGGVAGSVSEEDLEKELKRAWGELSGGALELVNYYQRCSLAGGRYYARRFSRPGSAEKPYKPYLLSDEGSAFLLRAAPGREAEAAKVLDGWLARGIPLAPSLIAFYDIPPNPRLFWKYCPYLPENGYGEITVNQGFPFAEGK